MATRHRLSPHFVIEEFDCHNGTKVKPRDYAGLRVICTVYLEELRRKFGPVTILSAYRPAGYNRSIGGASRSFHIYDIHDGNDQAVDFMCARGTPEQWHSTTNWIRNHRMKGRGGLGLYPRNSRRRGFVHIDTRDYRANWRG